jgi:hypothetical protein
MMGKFTYSLNKIKKVMGFKANHVVTNKESEINTKVDENVSISKKEIEILLQMIKNSHFSGDMLETLYTLVYKLQKHYNKL